MNKLGVAALLAASVSAQAEVNNTSPETQNTVDTLKQEVALICGKNNIITQTGAKLSAEQLLQECKNKIAEKDVRNTLLVLGANPTLVEGAKIGNYIEPELDKSKFVLKTELFGDKFTQENIADKLESIAKNLNITEGSQYNQGDWTKSMMAMNPNDDEAQTLNDYVAKLDESVDALTAWQGATNLLATKRFANHPESIPENQRETMEFLLVDNIYSIIRVLRPDLLKDEKILVLPEAYDGKSYKFIETNYEVISVVNNLLPESDKIRADKISDFTEVYAQVLEAGKSEYIDTYLATDEAKEDEVTREDMEEEYAELLDFLERDVYENDFPELITQYAPNLGVNLIEMLPLKGDSKFAQSLSLHAKSNEQMQLLAQLKAEGNRLDAEGNRLDAEGNRLDSQIQEHVIVASKMKAEGDKYAQIVKNYEKLGVKQD